MRISYLFSNMLSRSIIYMHKNITINKKYIISIKKLDWSSYSFCGDIVLHILCQIKVKLFLI